MPWEVEHTDEFGRWYMDLELATAESVAMVVDLLEERGPDLPFPLSSSVESSRHGHMRELRVQHAGRRIRILYAFDPRRTAVLLLGGDKTGDGRWYRTHVPLADRLYDEHLDTLKREGLI
ncbi:MAG TPA: type II toxin-antitoxin system RelE/ParE family toxin [Longimicrobiaceae bacterium]|nr:type II toxin-antitoxin system RelE/ParE family toxin [Longimicrobiaceae bacterium]